MSSFDELIAQISRLSENAKTLRDNEQRKQQKLNADISRLSAKNQRLEINEKYLSNSISRKDKLISQLQTQIQEQKKTIDSYTSQINNLKSEIESLKFKLTQATKQHDVNGIVNGNTSETPTQPFINQPFISHITWSQCRKLKIGDKIDYR